MDLVDAKVFVSVAEELSYRRAAERLSYSVASVSTRIRRLEQELGVKLFTRTSRHVELTSAGRHLLKDAKVVLHSVDLLLGHAQEFRGRVHSELLIAYSPSSNIEAVALVRALRRLNEPHGADLVSVRASPDAVRAVLDGVTVAGVCRMASPRLRSMPLAHPQPGAFLVPIDHKLASRRAISIRDLDGVSVVMWKRELNPEHYDLFVGFLHSHGASPRLEEKEIIGVASMTECVAIGDGVAFVPLATQPVPGTTVVPIVGPSPPLTQSYLLWRQNEHEAIVEMLVSAAAIQGSTPLDDEIPVQLA